MLNGLELADPWSAHYNHTLPFPSAIFGPAQRQVGLKNTSRYASGAVALDIVMQRPGVRVQSAWGSNARSDVAAHAYTPSGKDSPMLGGVFLQALSAESVDLSGNDATHYLGGGQLQEFVNEWQLDLLAGHQEKQFGARGYDGMPSHAYAEEGLKDTLVLFGATRGSPDDLFLRFTGAWRERTHRFEIPDQTFGYGSRSRVAALMLEGRTIEVQDWSVYLRSALDVVSVEDVHRREQAVNGDVLLQPQARFEHFLFQTGLRAAVDEGDMVWLPQAAGEWFAGDNHSFFADYIQQVRSPDYRSSYFTSPYHLPDPTLPTAKISTTRMGFKQFLSEHLDWQTALFYRQIDHAHEQVKYTAADVQWQMADLGEVEALGLEASVRWNPSDTVRITGHYQWLTKKDDATVYAGLYELDYAEHLLRFTAAWQYSPQWSLYTDQAIRQMAAHPLRDGQAWLTQSALGLHYDPRQLHNVRLSLGIENLWDEEAGDIPGMRAPRRTVFGTVALSF